MSVLRNSGLASLAACCAVTVGCGLALAPRQAAADDIDIYAGLSAGNSDAPNIIFLIDNSPNWSRNSQHWPDNAGNQGAAELAAISTVVGLISAAMPANVGLAMLSSYSGTTANGATPGSGGGYIRFAARDMTVAANKTALQNILAGIAANINSPNEKLTGMSSKDEDGGFYEVYKYLSGLAPFTGPYGSSYAAQNGYVDIAGNASAYTAASQGLTSGYAIVGGNYVSPISATKPCGRTYIVYIANNANNIGSTGQAAYQSAIANVAPALVATPLQDTWTDEWTKFLYSSGAVVPAGNNNGSVVTYVLDAYSAQQNVGYSNSLMSAAKQGGGKYFQVGKVADIQNALATIFAEIQAVNSTFASVTLPLNSINKTEVDNEVFIPVFRPDANDQPRWMGNLKRYAIDSSAQLVDSTNVAVVNPLTGFPTACATSYWTSDTGAYWNFTPEGPYTKSQCAGPPTGTNPYNAYSDKPDGPVVEKGGVAEEIRRGNNPPLTDTVPTWLVNRKLYTESGGSLVTFNTANTGLSATLLSWISGVDVNDENGNLNVAETRPSLHGDVIHSRPLAVDYGTPTGVVVYYGANDGMLRAVSASNGQELWALIAPEFYSSTTAFTRLTNDSPLVNYFGMPSGITPTPTPKDYFWDGALGIYEGSGNSPVWIYPVMRRGGRMIYALNATTPSAPALLWKVGCANLANDTGCTSGMSGIGQTWSTPMAAASVLGYSGPVVIVGGGYDACEDANTVTPSCTTPKGAGVYVLDAGSGTLVASFSTTRSVPADVALISVSTPGVVDHAYAADTGGNIYRIDFAANKANWAIHRVAYTNGAGRKFLFTPAPARAPSSQGYVGIGAGDREHPLQSQYPYSGVVNRLYVYRDSLGSTSASNLDDTSAMTDFTSGTTCSTQGVLPGSSMKGWFMNLNQNGQGEQTVSAAGVASGMVLFNTNRPIPAAQGSCSTTLGEARGYWVNLLNASGGIGVKGAACGGARSSIYVGGGLPPSPVIDVVMVGTSAETVVFGAAQLDGGASSVIGSQQVQPAITPKRKTVFWKSSGEN